MKLTDTEKREILKLLGADGPLRDQIEKAGGLILIYLDPPFDVVAGFSMDIEIFDETFTKKPIVLEEIACRDSWGKGADSFIAMIYERLVLMRDLLAEDGSIYAHRDVRVSGYSRLVLEEQFGSTHFRSEISRTRTSSHNDAVGKFGPVKDSSFYLGKTEKTSLNRVFTPYSPEYIDAEWNPLPSGRYFKAEKMPDPQGKMPDWNFHGTATRWPSTPEKMEALWNAPQTEVPDSHGRIKPGKDGFPIQPCRIVFLDEMSGVPLNDLRNDNKSLAGGAMESQNFIGLILKACTAETVENFTCFHGKKAGRVVAVGAVNIPVTSMFVEETILECREKRISRVDILAFESEMGLFPTIQEDARATGIDLGLKYIPREVFYKRAIGKNQIVFHDVSYIEVMPHGRKNTIAVELTDFSVYYSQESVDFDFGSRREIVRGRNEVSV